MERVGGRTPRGLASAILVCVLTVLSGCEPNGDDPTTSPTTSGALATTTIGSGETIPLASAPPVATTGSAEEQLDWYLNVLNGTAELDEAAYQQRCSPELRDELPFEQFRGLTNQFSTIAPVTLASTEPTPTGELDPEGTTTQQVAAVVVSNSGSGFLVELGVDADGQISFLDVQVEEDPILTAEPSDLDGAANEVRAYGDYLWAATTVDLDVASVEQVGCSITDGEGYDQVTGVDAASAIWVLGALADAILAGDLTWDTELTVTEQNKSLDPGVLHERPAPSPVSVQEAAKLMFEFSDNTAFDLLVDAVGREGVEAAQERWGNTAASENVPFLTTREMLVLKTSTTEAQNEYLSATPEQRRAILPQLGSVSAEEIPIDVFLQGPIRPTEINWFATPADLCTGLARLMWAGINVDGLSPVVDIITSSHGVSRDAQWDEIAFKGGAEPGALTMAWVMATETNDRNNESDLDWYGYVGNMINSSDDFAKAEPTLLIASGRDLVAPPATDPGSS